jgi:hypothetical protein
MHYLPIASAMLVKLEIHRLEIKGRAALTPVK